jgi:hypothetical protein
LRLNNKNKEKLIYTRDTGAVSIALKKCIKKIEMEVKNMKRNGKQAVIEQLWMVYFNNTLYAAGLITAEQRNKIHNKIIVLIAQKIKSP